MRWYITCLKKYAVFTGRARRKEFWMFTLFHLLFAFTFLCLDTLLGLKTGFLPIGFLQLCYAVAIFMPGLAVTVRRLHDIGKSGWLVFLVLIPVIGAVWLLIYTLLDSRPEANQYGLNPKIS